MRQVRGAIYWLSFVFIGLSIFISTSGLAQEKKALTLVDIMKFKETHHETISEDGKWIAYTAQPDRGDGEVRIHSTEQEKTFAIERGSRPVISSDSRWIGAFVLPKAEEDEKAKKDKPKKGMALLNTKTGEIRQWEKINQFEFSNDANWLVLHHYKEDLKNNNKKPKQPEPKEGETKMKKNQKKKKLIYPMSVKFLIKKHWMFGTGTIH